MKILMFSLHSMKYLWYSQQKSKYPLYINVTVYILWQDCKELRCLNFLGNHHTCVCVYLKINKFCFQWYSSQFLCQIRVGNHKIFFLVLHEIICCWYSLEVPRWGISDEHQNICFQGGKKNISTFWSKNVPYVELWFLLFQYDGLHL